MLGGIELRTLLGLMFKVLLSASLFIFWGNVHADAPQEAPSLRVFFVSVLLRKQDEPVVVKLVHSVQSAQTKDAAEQSFFRLIARDFPGYTVISTLTSPETAITPPRCEQRPLGMSI